MVDRCIKLILTILVSLSLVACGTVLYPERKGQVDGQIDPAIAILNGLGLLLFFVPGVIAFAVDFSNGTIYLPDGRTSQLSRDEMMRLQQGEIDRETLAARVTGQTIDEQQIRVRAIGERENLRALLGEVGR